MADLRAATRLGIELKIFRMNSLGISQDRITKRLGQTREVIRDHLAKMAELPNPPNADLSPGFTVSQVAEKHNWTEPMVWSLTLEGRDDLEKFKEGGWGLSTWDEWEWNDCLPRLTSLFLLFNWGMSMTAKQIQQRRSVFHCGDKRFGDDPPALPCGLA